MTNPVWFGPVFTARQQYPTARARLCKSTRYAILDSDDADNVSLLASMKELCGALVILDEAVPDGQIILETEGPSGWTTATTITLAEKV